MHNKEAGRAPAPDRRGHQAPDRQGGRALRGAGNRRGPRRLERTDLVESVPGVSCAELPGLFAAYDRIWRWYRAFKRRASTEWAGLLEIGRRFVPRYAQPGEVGRLLRIARAIDAGEIGRVRRLVFEAHVYLGGGVPPPQGGPGWR